MKRVSEKVKDIVEVRSFAQISDFGAEPRRTVEAYRFTEITAGLMAKWLDGIAGVRPGDGQTLAIAGLRGVGKSHFLAVIAAVVGDPALRNEISDPHVKTAAEHLARRPSKVFVVRRGSAPTLVAELKQATADVLERPLSELSDSVNDLLLTIFERGGEAPLLLFDTALDREARVSRDDGPVLSEIAMGARAMGLFVGVALDDDISGADGANASIVANFTIDYLDLEHLYKIVDNHIFAKRTQKLPVLHEIYEDYRSRVPGFRWSEQRFTALYPLHPEALEIAPLIRLFVHDFALLGFASESGAKVLGRPANSLIGLDELFDSVESKLRRSSELESVFAAYDRIEREAIATLPVKQRHVAKLALKGLFILSLNGQGATAADISASMMILPDDESSKGDVEAILQRFAEALPEAVSCVAGAATALKFSFRLDEKDLLHSRLSELESTVDERAIWQVLLRQTAEKFSDLEISDQFGTSPTPCNVEWRGAVRRGEIFWGMANETQPHRGSDFRLLIVQEGGEEPSDGDPGSDSYVWLTALPTPEETAVLRRHHLLQTDASLRESNPATWSTAAHLHSIMVEKVWQRLFLDDAQVLTPMGATTLSEETRTAYTISHLLTMVLAPSLEAAFPAHPMFTSPLTPTASSLLIGSFFSGIDTTGESVQRAAAAFAVPLGLAVQAETMVVAASAGVLMGLEMLQPLLEVAAAKGRDVIPVDAAGSSLRSGPYGLSRDTQQLVLAALVAQGQFEFVTTTGDRINHRSLDLQIVWDDIAGIALPDECRYSPERLLAWARLITGNTALKSVDRAVDRELINDSLTAWLEGWRASSILQDLGALDDQSLNTRLWRLGTNLRRSLSPMAEVIADPARDERHVEDCLKRIADLFSDSESNFEARKAEMRDLAALIAQRREARARLAYLALADMTDDPVVEEARSLVLKQEPGIDEDERWRAFRSAYADHYILKHSNANSAARSDAARSVLASDAFGMFESVACLPWFDARRANEIKETLRQLRRPPCEEDVAAVLEVSPVCHCGFRAETEDAASQETVETALFSSLSDFVGRLMDARADVAEAVSDAGYLVDRISVETSSLGSAELSHSDILLLRRAADLLGGTSASETDELIEENILTIN
ncbi:MAG: hypothetical protein IPM59_11380 [Chloracidobacterium sp.]|nr:hypothetical protein [Chloracidobacterium sp.]